MTDELELPETGPSTAPGTAPWSSSQEVSRSNSGRTRRGSARSMSRGRLGAGLVEVPRVPYRDPKTAVLEQPEVPEAKRFCSKCGKKVGRRKDGKQGRVEGFCPQCGHAYSFTPKLAPGEVLHDQYEVLGCLAHGGLGWLYLALDHAVSDRWVVLKGLLDSGDADAMAAALAERRFLAEVEHPNIVKIHNFIRHESRDSDKRVEYIVMEYVGGESIKDMITRRRREGRGDEALPLAQAIAYVLEILPAVGYLHGVGLLYCDFKPDNMIHTEEQLKLIDLGAVRRIDDHHSPIYGTIGYQAPEIGTIGPSVFSDIYTVGRALAVMSFPFDFRGRCKDRLPTVDEEPLLGRFESFHRLLLRATNPNPELRFSSAEDMAEQLTGVLREVLAIEDGVPRPGLSRQFTPERRRFGVEGSLDLPEVALALPAPSVSTSDAAASWLATATTSDPAGLRKAPELTVEVRLRIVRVLIESGDTEAAMRELESLTAPSMFDEPELDPAEDWRPDWYRGLAALTDGRAADALGFFDAVCSAVPGEAAPKLALGVCAEATGDLKAAAGWYELVWSTDHSYVSAAFGLGRVLLACGDRARAVEVLLSVPDTSSQHLAAQIAAVRAQLGDCGAEDLVAAGERLHALDIDVHSHTQLSAEVLEAAYDYVTRNQAAEGKVLDCALSEHELRLGLEARYRTLARFAATPEERIALVDRANAVRPRTLV
ncbi:tetratricopeptide repeat protein [Lentzea sp. NPDC102401]|uniref:serine/threonine-protein kinase n=1 Tax=Lentzea sp. NPDC102401 TaxID=3364128 RepID=UPI00381C4943